MMGIILQLIVATVGGLAIAVRGFKKYKLLGCIIGLVSCPCWIALEIYYEQWYVLPVNVLYIIGWWKSFKEHYNERINDGR